MVTVSSEGADLMSDMASQIPEFGYDERVMICRKQIEKAVYQFIANTKVEDAIRRKSQWRSQTLPTITFYCWPRSAI